MLKFLRQKKLFIINVTSASALLALGDFFAQKFYENKKQLDKKRFVAAALTGAVLGVEGHLWYSFLDRFIAQVTWKNVGKKVLLDQTIAAPIYTVTYIFGTSILEGRTTRRDLRNDVRMNFFPLYFADCAVFIPVQMINFRYVSPYYRVSFMFLISFLFNTFLSAFKHADEVK